MIGAGWTALFGILQALDPVYEVVPGPNGQAVQFPVWPIHVDEAKKLGEASAMFLATLPAARRKTIAKFLNQYAPGIILGAAIYEVGAPRAQFSLKAKADLRERTMAAQRAYAGNGPSPGGGQSGNGAAQAAHGPHNGVSAPAGSSAHPPGEAAAANANRNGAAHAFDDQSGLG